jgi:hypothetical protein
MDDGSDDRERRILDYAGPRQSPPINWRSCLSAVAVVVAATLVAVAVTWLVVWLGL